MSLAPLCPGVSLGVGGGRTRPCYEDSDSESLRSGRVRLDNKFEASDSGGHPGRRKRRPQEEIGGSSEEARGGEEESQEDQPGKGPRKERERQRSPKGSRQKEQKEKGEGQELLEHFKPEETKKETSRGPGGYPCERRRRRRSGQRTGEGKSLGSQQFELITRYRRRAGESEDDVPRHSDGSVGQAEETGTEEGTSLSEKEEKQLHGVGILGRVEGCVLEGEPVVWRRAEDQRSCRKIPGPPSRRGVERDLQDGGFRYGRQCLEQPRLAAPAGEVLCIQAGSLPEDLRCHGERTVDTLQCDRQSPRGQSSPSPGYMPPEDKGARTASWRNQLPGEPALGSAAERGGHATQQAGVGHHPARAHSGGQSLRRTITAGAELSRERKGGAERRTPSLQRKGEQRKREREERPKEAGGSEERRLKPTSVLQYESGRAVPDGGVVSPGVQLWAKSEGEKLGGVSPEVEREESDVREEKRYRGCREETPMSTDVTGGVAGLMSPGAGGNTLVPKGTHAVTMRELFPRYEGPLASKNILFLESEGQSDQASPGSSDRPKEPRRRCFPTDAVTRSVLPRGDVSREQALAAPSQKESPLGVVLGHLGGLICSRFLGVLLHSQSTGGGKTSKLFPLPTSRDRIIFFFSTAQDHEVDWVMAICLGLNSYWGGPLYSDAHVSLFHGKILDGFLHDVHRLGELRETIDEFDWHSFFQCRTIDYTGEEIKTAKSFSWANIGPALPKEIGVVPLREVCEQGCQFYVDHFPEFLKDVGEWPPLKRSRVMVSDRDWPEVAVNLVESGICAVIPESEVFKVHGQPLLNGLFGVEKGEECGGIPIYLLIMNLVPLNGMCLNLAGDIGGLPHWLGMNPFSLEPSEGLLVSSEDVRCFFYTLALPEAWKPFLAFNRVIPPALQPEGCNEPCYLTSRVLPMGFINSVGIAQHVHRVLVQRSVPRPLRDLASREIRKDAPLPDTSSAWRVYLDNYDLLEKFPRECLVEHRGTVAPEVMGLRGAYESVGMPRHEGKSVSREVKAEVQGAIVDGAKGLAYPKGGKLIKYTVMAILFCQLSYCSQRQAQVICGGLVYFSTFRRQLLGSLNACWAFIESFNHAGRHHLPIPHWVKLEILRCVCLVPLCRMDFRLDMKEQVTCSDASTTGGGICCSTGLSPAGHMVSQGELRPEGNPLDGRPKLLMQYRAF